MGEWMDGWIDGWMDGYRIDYSSAEVYILLNRKSAYTFQNVKSLMRGWHQRLEDFIMLWLVLVPIFFLPYTLCRYM